MGDTPRAEAQLAAIPQDGDSERSYQYMLAKAIFTVNTIKVLAALTAFAQPRNPQEKIRPHKEKCCAPPVTKASGEQQVKSGIRFFPGPNLRDSTVYSLDARLLNAPQVSCPRPGRPSKRSGLQPIACMWPECPMRVGLPDSQRSRRHFPPQHQYDCQSRHHRLFLNFAVNPVFQLGSNALSVSAGLQRTIRRDSETRST